jgi:hypothetical protein
MSKPLTVPAPKSERADQPALRLLPSRLTLLAIEAGVSVADAAAYNTGRTPRGFEISFAAVSP